MDMLHTLLLDFFFVWAPSHFHLHTVTGLAPNPGNNQHRISDRSSWNEEIAATGMR